jgi:hypothetical protein
MQNFITGHKKLSAKRYHSTIKKEVIKLIMVILYSLLIFEAFEKADARPDDKSSSIGPGAIFHPEANFLKIFHTRCDSLQYPKFGECFVSVMKGSGASSQALAFSRLIDNTGYMRDFREMGKIDVAYVTYPFRANENEGFCLVNGTPLLIDVDDLKALPRDDLEKDARYLKIVKKYPRADLFPGERFRTIFPESSSLPGGGQHFTIIYWLKDGCRACERIGLALYAFDFDSSGKFLGRKFLKVVPTKIRK